MAQWLHTHADGFPEDGERVWLWTEGRTVRGFFRVDEGEAVRGGRFTGLDGCGVLLVVWWRARKEDEEKAPTRPPKYAASLRDDWGDIETEWADLLTIFTAAEIPGLEHGDPVLVRVGSDFFAGRYDVTRGGFVDLEGRLLQGALGWRPRDFPNPRAWPGRPE